MTVDAVVDLVRAAAEAHHRSVSPSLPHLYAKLARGAQTGSAAARSPAEQALREQVRQLIQGWRIGDEHRERTQLEPICQQPLEQLPAASKGGEALLDRRSVDFASVEVVSRALGTDAIPVLLDALAGEAVVPEATRRIDGAEWFVQRLEFPAAVTRDDYDLFLNELLSLLKLPGADLASARSGLRTTIRYGAVSVRSDDDGAPAVAVQTAVDYSLREEVTVARYLYETAERTGVVPLAEVEGIVRSLALTMHGDGALVIPLLRLKTFDEYAVLHSMNVAVLTMTFAEARGIAPRDVHAFGIAGLLRDIGMTRVPRELTLNDALRTARPFRPAWPAQQALAFVDDCGGTQFDPAGAQSFVATMRRLEGRMLLAAGASEPMAVA